MKDFPRVTAPDPTEGKQDVRVMDLAKLPYQDRRGFDNLTRIHGEQITIEPLDKETEQEDDFFIMFRRPCRAAFDIDPSINLAVPYQTRVFRGLARPEAKTTGGIDQYVFDANDGNGPYGFNPAWLSEPCIMEGEAAQIQADRYNLDELNSIDTSKYSFSERDATGRFTVTERVGDQNIFASAAAAHRVLRDVLGVPSDVVDNFFSVFLASAGGKKKSGFINLLPRWTTYATDHYPLVNLPDGYTYKEVVGHLTPGFRSPTPTWGYGYVRPKDYASSTPPTRISYDAPQYVSHEGKNIYYRDLPHEAAWGDKVEPPIVVRTGKTSLSAVVVYGVSRRGYPGNTAIPSGDPLDYLKFTTSPKLFSSNDNGATWASCGGFSWGAGFDVDHGVPLPYNPIAANLFLYATITTEMMRATRGVPFTPGVALFISWVPESGLRPPVGPGDTPPSYPVLTTFGHFHMYLVKQGGYTDLGILEVPPYKYGFSAPGKLQGGYPESGIGTGSLWTAYGQAGVCRPAGAVVATFFPRPHKLLAGLRFDGIDPEDTEGYATQSRLAIITDAGTAGVDVVFRDLPFDWVDTCSAAFCYLDKIAVIVSRPANGRANPTLYTSADLGVTWKRGPVLERSTLPYRYAADADLFRFTSFPRPTPYPDPRPKLPQYSDGYGTIPLSFPPHTLGVLRLAGKPSVPYPGAPWIY